MSIRLELAKLEDEAELRSLIANTPVNGKVRVAHAREPHFFSALDVLGQFNQIQVARETQTQRIIALATRSIKSIYINGEIRQAGFLGNLRIANDFRGGTTLAKGFKHLQQLHSAYPCPFYLTTIMADNRDAQSVLLNARGNLPPYYHWGQYHHYMITASRDEVRLKNTVLQRATVNDLIPLVEFLQYEGSKKQFFPYYTINDFKSSTGLLRGLDIEDILLAKRDESIVGVLGVWNQESFKQARIESYHPVLNSLRPLYNMGAKLFKKPTLSNVGEALSFNYAALVVTQNNDPAILRILINAGVRQTLKEEKAYLALGLHTDDELNEALFHFHFQRMNSNLYVVSFEEKNLNVDKLKQFVPYMELGAL